MLGTSGTVTAMLYLCMCIYSLPVSCPTAARVIPYRQPSAKALGIGHGSDENSIRPFLDGEQVVAPARDGRRGHIRAGPIVVR